MPVTNNIILDIPMDEVANSPIAYDFGPQGTHAKVRNSTFVPGHDGKALRTGLTGIAKTRNTLIELEQDFTVSVFVRNRQFPGYAAPLGVTFEFEMNAISFIDYQYDVPDLDTWVHWVFVKTPTGAKIYKNAVQVATVPFGATDLTAWAIKQLIPEVDNGFTYTLPMTFSTAVATGFTTADIDSVLIYDRALTDEEIRQIDVPEANVMYWIDDHKFLDFKVFVEESHGLIDSLRIKDPVKVDWAGEHGVSVDLERPRFMPREITLDCFFESDGFMDFTMQMNEFLAYFKGKGTHRLKVEIDNRRPLVYEVYMEEASNIDKKWRAGKFYGKFSLKLIEYLPVKRVLRFVKNNTQNTLQINIDSKTPFNIYWGDGTVTENVLGQQLLSHTYQEEKIYQIICAGVLEDINAFSHTGILLWSSL